MDQEWLLAMVPLQAYIQDTLVPAEMLSLGKGSTSFKMDAMYKDVLEWSKLGQWKMLRATR